MPASRMSKSRLASRVTNAVAGVVVAVPHAWIVQEHGEDCGDLNPHCGAFKASTSAGWVTKA